MTPTGSIVAWAVAGQMRGAPCLAVKWLMRAVQVLTSPVRVNHTTTCRPTNLITCGSGQRKKLKEIMMEELKLTPEMEEELTNGKGDEDDE